MRARPPTLLLAALVAVGCSETTGPTVVADEALVAPSTAVLPGADGLAFSSPVFGLSTAPDGSIFAAETFVGVTAVRKGVSSVIAPIAGVAGVAAAGGGNLFAVTGAALDPSFAADEKKLFRVSKGATRLIADLGAYEDEVNPDQIWNAGPPDSNPFNVAHLDGGNVLVADAAANAVLHVGTNGAIDWVAVLTPILASTDHFKELIGCNGLTPPPDCDFLPPQIPAQPVATSVAVGPDGAYYAGELTGFPAEPGISRVWRIEAGSRNVLCPSDACTLALDGFTSIVDLTFGPDGTLYVVELDEGTWLATEIGGFPVAPTVLGGTVNACDVSSGVCGVVASGLSLPSAVTVGKDGTVWVAESPAIPGGGATISSIN